MDVINAARDFHESLKRDGLTATVSSGGRSATVGANTDTRFTHSTIKPHPPAESEFERLDVDYIPDSELMLLGRWLIENRRGLKHLDSVSIAYLWKAKGGKSGGKEVFGKCAKTPPLVRAYEQSTFTIWLAADNVRDYRMNDNQIEALLFHELCHASIEEVENETTGDVSFKPVVLAHDVEMFLSELDEYGLWRTDLTLANSAFQQFRLPGFDGEAA